MRSVLEEVAASAASVADDQRAVARKAKAMKRKRDRGWSWGRILDQEASPGVLELLRRSSQRLAETTIRFAKTLAHGLSREGESRRQISRRLGVSHQRVSAMLKSRRPLGKKTKKGLLEK